MDMGTISAAVSSLKTAGEIAKALIQTNNLAEIQAKSIDLNYKIIEAQQQLLEANETQRELLEKIRALQAQIQSMNNWETEKRRYELISPFPGCVVYALLKSASNGVAPHYICTSCYQKGQASILQARPGVIGKGREAGCSRYVCPTCHSEALTSWSNVSPFQYFEDIKIE